MRTICQINAAAAEAPTTKNRIATKTKIEMVSIIFWIISNNLLKK
jgi:hypothetical protein